MKKLSEVKCLDNSTLKNISEIIAQFKNSAHDTTKERISESIRSIAKKENRPLKSKVLSDFNDEKVIPIISPSTMEQVPPYIPMWITRTSRGDTSAIVNITRFSRIDKKTNDLSIYPKTLFGLLLGGTVLKALTESEYSILNSTKLLTSLSIIYSRIFSKILDKNYAISANELFLDQIKYLSAKFFLLSVVGRPDNPSTTNIALKSISYSSSVSVKQIDASIPAGSYSDILTFLDALKSQFKRLDKLTYRSILADIAKQYSAPAFLILEYCPFFIANILYAVTNSGINNEYSFESVLGKEGIYVYQELSRLI